SIIDLIMTNIWSHSLVSLWKTDMNYSGSDHRFCTFDTNATRTLANNINLK
ncbi:Hypothetical protein FKW44_012658, partial [Caligus rogercresseyi]